MRISFAVLAALACGASFTAVCAQDVGPAPVRRLVYEVTYRTTSTSETKLSAVSNDRRRVGGQYVPNINLQSAAHRTETLAIDVVAVTADGGLVVDAKVDGAERRAPTARIAIFRDGTLSYDPNATVLEEERRLLSLLRRDGFDHELTARMLWREPIEEKLAKGSTEYRVLRADGPLMQIEITRQVFVSGANAYDENSRLVAEYDPYLRAPSKATVQLRVRINPAATQVVIQDTEIDMRLVEDSFKKKE